MKTILYIILFSVELCYAQFIPHKASVTASKDSVLSSEQFTVTYSLTEVEGYVYIGVFDDYFESIGKDRWEGKIKADETKKVTFTVKLREGYKKAWIKERYPLAVGFSYKPFREKILGEGEFESIIIKITDFKEYKPKTNGVIEENDSSESINKTNGFNNININNPSILNINTPRIRETFSEDPYVPKQEYFRNRNSNTNNISETNSPLIKSEILEKNLDKSHLDVNSHSPSAITINFMQQQ